MKNQVSSFYKDAAAAVDAGLRKYMLKVFSHMSLGLAVTALAAYFISTSPTFMQAIFSSPGLMWGLLFAELGVVIYLSARIDKMSVQTSQMCFYSYALLSGISLAPVFLIYTGESIATTFFVTSATFLSMVIYGYTTDKDLTSMGSFLMMGLFGLIIASLVNIFLKSSALLFATSIIGIVIFTGLTAWDTQIIKSLYFEGESQEASEKKSIMGALRLYLDFINMFLYLLRFFGNRRN
jgi:hypothetical protein